MNEFELFQSALEIDDPAARRQFLHSSCGDNAEMLRRVEALLASHESHSRFLKTPAVEQIVDVAEREIPATLLTGSGSTNDDDPPMSEPPEGTKEEIPLGYLEPSSKPGSLGRLAHYEVIEVIGRGAFGTVLRAFDEKLHRVVAIKVMASELATTSPARKRFLREAQASAAIRHQHVVNIHAVEEKPLPYLVMEYIPGVTLQQRLDAHGPLDVPSVLWLGRQIAEGLAAAHAINLIHRDIKPGNILLETGVPERVKITDFGLARAADDASLTQSGTIAGTPMYMAPEQALGKKLDQRADLFSLGSVLYQMVSGRPPFRAPSTLAVLKRVTEEMPRPIQEIIPEAPAWLCDLIAKLQAKNPDDRFQSAREVADLLAECEAKLNADARPRDFPRIPVVKAAKKSGNRLLVAAVVLLQPVLFFALTESLGITHWLKGRATDDQGLLKEVAPMKQVELERLPSPPSTTQNPPPSTPQNVPPNVPQNTTPANHRFAADEWIEVIPLIDPQRDKWNNTQTGTNEWRVEGSDLMTGYADRKACKLLVPLDAAWEAFECEVEFTRRSGPGGFNIGIPTAMGDCPVVVGVPNRPGFYLGRRGGGVSLNDDVTLQTGARSKVRLEVRREQNQDHVAVWFNDAAAGDWTGDRARITNVLNEGYPNARRLGLWVPAGGNEFVFHRLRVRMLEGGTADSLRPVPVAPAPGPTSGRE